VYLYSHTSLTLMTWCLGVGASLLSPLQQVTVHKVSRRHLRDRQFLLTYPSPVMHLSLLHLPFFLLLLLLYDLFVSFPNTLIFPLLVLNFPLPPTVPSSKSSISSTPSSFYSFFSFILSLFIIFFSSYCSSY